MVYHQFIKESFERVPLPNALPSTPKAPVNAVNLRRIALIYLDACDGGPFLKQRCECQRAVVRIHLVYAVFEKPQIVISPRLDNLIFFSDDDLKLLDYPHSNTLILALQISNCEVGHLFIYLGVGMNIIFNNTLQ